jgi:DNA polymerase III subunit epsilon
MKCLEQSARLERAAKFVASSDDYRVQRRLPSPTQKLAGNRPPDGTTCIAIVDCETTSLSPYTGKLIELAIMLAFMSEGGEVVAHLGPWSWLQDPGEPLSAETTAITGLTDADVAGQAIDDRMATSLLDRADWVVAHHAAFDIQWLDHRYPHFRSKPWACSMAELPWRDWGYETRSLQPLLWQHGMFSNAHRAGDDVWALFNLLSREREDDLHDTRSYLSQLIRNASTPSVRVAAVGAPFASKDMLRERGYRWDRMHSVWAKLVGISEVSQEQAWFRAEALPGPRLSNVDAVARHR